MQKRLPASGTGFIEAGLQPGSRALTTSQTANKVIATTGSMPPILPRSSSLSEKDNIIVSKSIDQSTIALILSIKRLENDISTFQIPRLRSIVTDDSSKVNLATQQRYAAELRADIEKVFKQVEVSDSLIR